MRLRKRRMRGKLDGNDRVYFIKRIFCCSFDPDLLDLLIYGRHIWAAQKAPLLLVITVHVTRDACKNGCNTGIILP